VAAPNESGRSWEAILSLALLHFGGTLSDRTSQYNLRDGVTEATIPPALMRAAMEAAGVVLKDWDTLRSIHDANKTSFLIDRQPDRALGNSVADIKLIADTDPLSTTKISVKSNNRSLRHNRPRTLARPFGRAGEVEDLTHRNQLLQIDREIRRRFPHASRFSELSLKEKRFVTYMVTIVCTRSIQEWTERNSSWTSQFIRFLLGSEEDLYYVIHKGRRDETLVYKIKSPQNITIESISRRAGYILIDTEIDSVKVTFSGRVHSCTTDISHPGETLRSDYRDEWKFDWTSIPYIGDAVGTQIVG
jgi:hypothetical protein